jgi:hypothetical protein
MCCISPNVVTGNDPRVDDGATFHAPFWFIPIDESGKTSSLRLSLFKSSD